MDTPKVCSGKPGEAEQAIEGFVKREQYNLVNELVLHYIKDMPFNEAFKFKQDLTDCNAARRKVDPHLPEIHVY